MRRPRWLSAVVAVLSAALLLILAVTGRLQPDRAIHLPGRHVLAMSSEDLPSANRVITEAMAREIAASAHLEDGYPRVGWVELVDSATQPDFKDVNCVAAAGREGLGRCVLLDARGSIIEASTWTVPNALPFSASVYLLAPGDALDLENTPRVQIKIVLLDPRGPVEAIYRATGKALQDLGAKRLDADQIPNHEGPKNTKGGNR